MVKSGLVFLQGIVLIGLHWINDVGFDLEANWACFRSVIEIYAALVSTFALKLVEFLVSIWLYRRVLNASQNVYLSYQTKATGISFADGYFDVTLCFCVFQLVRF